MAIVQDQPDGRRGGSGGSGGSGNGGNGGGGNRALAREVARLLETVPLGAVVGALADWAGWRAHHYNAAGDAARWQRWKKAATALRWNALVHLAGLEPEGGKAAVREGRLDPHRPPGR